MVMRCCYCCLSLERGMWHASDFVYKGCGGQTL